MRELRFSEKSAEIESFCRRWQIVEFAMFGSVLREDFGQESDINVVVTFSENTYPSLFDFVTMEQELSDIFGRPVDIVEKSAIRNPFRRYEILRTMELVYAA